jgi:hypothetical protein
MVSQLEPHITASHDDEVLWQPVEIEELHMGHRLDSLGRVDDVLAWQAGDVRARTTDQLPLHDSRVVAFTRHRPGQVLASLAAADHAPASTAEHRPDGRVLARDAYPR